MGVAVYEAALLYMLLVEFVGKKLAKEVRQEISREELVHAGEFLRLLKEWEPKKTRSTKRVPKRLTNNQEVKEIKRIFRR